MKKKIVGFMLALCMLIAILPPAYADYVIGEKCGDNLEWRLNGDTLIISGEGELYNYNKGNTVPPWHEQRENIKNIVIENGVTYIGYMTFSDCIHATQITVADSVTEISYNAFADAMTNVIFSDTNPNFSFADGLLLTADGKTIRQALSTIKGAYTIPDGIEVISAYSFRSHDRITDIVMPNSIIDMEEGAFAYCRNLKTIRLSESLTNIAPYAFEECEQLESIFIPAGVSNISIGWAWYSDAFDGCVSLQEISVDKNNEHYADIDGVLFDKSLKTIMKCPYARTGDYRIPDGVEVVGYLKTATTAGGWQVFGDKLNSVTLPSSVKEIGDYPKVNIIVDEGNQYYSAENGILFNKDKTALLSYPSKKTGAYTIPDNVNKINSNVFSGCEGLESITISKNITEKLNFYGCVNLTDIFVDHDNADFCDINGVLFDKEKTTLLFYPQGKSGAYITPEGMTAIGDYSFQSCVNLTNVIIKDGVEKIGWTNFVDCPNLKSVVVPDSVTEIQSFHSPDENFMIYGHENSYIQNYASENHLPFDCIGGTVTENEHGAQELTFTPKLFDGADSQTMTAIPVAIGDNVKVMTFQQTDDIASEQKITLSNVEAGSVVKVFLWDSVKGMKPLAEPVIAVVE